MQKGSSNWVYCKSRFFGVGCSLFHIFFKYDKAINWSSKPPDVYFLRVYLGIRRTQKGCSHQV